MDIFIFTNRHNCTFVAHFWWPSLNIVWRQWKGKHDWPNPPNYEQWEIMEEELQSRNIAKIEGLDILRWGYTTKGMFTIKESYKLAMEEPQYFFNPIWRKIWIGHFWPKVTYFLWLVCCQRIITWYQLQKGGVQGPSLCSIFESHN